VIRESGGDFSAVTGGTRVLSDWLVVRVTRQSGRDLRRPHDRHGRNAKRQKTPNEIALTILLVALTIVFLASPSRCCRSRVQRAVAGPARRSASPC
jgi:K+-transporting ATPase ATPase B chain